MNASDKILMARAKAADMLHLSRNASYRYLARTRFKGRVSVGDVRKLMERSARNGAKWNGGALRIVDETTLGISRRTLFRVLKDAPHFRITRKVALVEDGALEEFLKARKSGK